MIARKLTILENALSYFTVRFICKLTARQDRSQYNEQITRSVKFTLFSNKTRSTRLKNFNKRSFTIMKGWNCERLLRNICFFYCCGFVALSVRTCVAGANRVEGTMSWCLETNEILASKRDIAKGQTRALWDHHLDSSEFFYLFVFFVLFALPNSIRVIQPLNVFKNRLKTFFFRRSFLLVIFLSNR